MPQFRSNADFGGVARIIGLLDGTSDGDAVTLRQLRSAVEGIAWKDSVRVAATANINLASPGATIDGISMALNDRVLLMGQTTASQNGIYVWNGAATALTRAPDANAADELEAAVVTVEEGTSANATFRQTAVNFVLDTGAVSFTTFGTATPQSTETVSGTSEIATQAEVDTGTNDQHHITALKLTNWSKRARERVQNFGDGTATQYDITHNWNTRNVSVEVIRNGTPWDTILCDVSRPDANTVRLNFSSAPTASQFTAVLRTGGTA